MKTVKKNPVFIIALVVIIALLLLVFIRNYKAEKYAKKIEKLFGDFNLTVPENKNIIYEESTFGGLLGDGEGLIIYQIDSKEMEKLTKQCDTNDWEELPIVNKEYIELKEKIGITSKEIDKYMHFNWQNGFYNIKDLTKPKHLRFYDFKMGIVDLKENKIYFYESHQ